MGIGGNLYFQTKPYLLVAFDHIAECSNQGCLCAHRSGNYDCSSLFSDGTRIGGAFFKKVFGTRDDQINQVGLLQTRLWSRRSLWGLGMVARLFWFKRHPLSPSILVQAITVSWHLSISHFWWMRILNITCSRRWSPNKLAACQHWRAQKKRINSEHDDTPNIFEHCFKMCNQQMFV